MNDIKINCSYTDRVDPATLVSNPRNPNTHTDKQIQILAKLIQMQGWRRPITVSSLSGFVIRGHGCLQAAKIIGCKTVPIDRQSYETEAEEQADMIADNQVAEMSQFDPKLLLELIEDLEVDGFNAELFGMNDEALEKLKIDYGLPDIEFPEYTEDAAKDVKKVVCPHCGKEFPL